MFKDKTIKIKHKTIDTISLLFLETPLLIFLFYWTNQYIGCITGGVIFSFHYYNWKKSKEKVIEIKIFYLMLIFLICMVWVFWSGIGGYFFQSSDHGARNAIYNDLLNFNWPVIYEKGRYLNYYFGYWLPPAFITKLIISFFSVDTLKIGEFILYIYTVIFVFIIILQILKRFTITKKNIIILISCLIFFSGLDVCALIIKLLLKGDFNFSYELAKWWNYDDSIFNHIEWWANHWQYSSNTTQLFWVFNQALPAWLATLLILNRNDFKQDLYIGVLTLFLAPFPACGLIIISIGKFFLNKNNIKEQIKSIISKENIFSVLFLIIISLFYIGNSRVKVINGQKLFSIIKFHDFELKDYILLNLHLIFEILLFIPIVKNSKYKIQAYMCIIYLLILPFINFRGSYDFQMRSSIPELFFIMLILMEQLVDFDKCSLKLKKLILLIVIFGSITPLVEFARGIKYMHIYGKTSNFNEMVSTFSNLEDENFIGTNFYESKYYKVLKNKDY